ncbi:MAG: BPTI/Kunitz domain-containing protein [Nanoarchaeota archaeon]
MMIMKALLILSLALVISACAPSEQEIISCTVHADCVPEPACHPMRCINAKFVELYEKPEICTMQFDPKAAYDKIDCLCVESTCTNKNLEHIPEPRDENGCLFEQGYYWKEQISACVLPEEFTDKEIELALLAIKKQGSSAGLAVIGIEEADCEFCYDVLFDLYGEKLSVRVDSENLIYSFEGCVEAGNPVIEEFPRRCKVSEGKYFLDEITGRTRCSLAPDPGPCKAAMERFYYNGRRCTTFTWGGCDGMVPFETLESCLETCE